MKDISKTRKILIMSIGAALLSWGLTSFLYLGISTQNKEVQALLVEAEKDIQKDQTLRVARTILQENKDAITELDAYFVSKDGVVPFIDQLEKLAEDSNVVISIISVASETDPKGKNDFKEPLVIRSDVTGSWNNVITFFDKLENLPYQMTIGSASLGLASASDKILFGSTSTTTVRQKSPDEFWKGSFEISVTKLK